MWSLNSNSIFALQCKQSYCKQRVAHGEGSRKQKFASSNRSPRIMGLAPRSCIAVYRKSDGECNQWVPRLLLDALHWLPVSFRIDFKILLLILKALNGLAFAYIWDPLTPHEPVCCLRSFSGAQLTVPKSQLVTKGNWAFVLRGPQLWISLLGSLRHANSLSSFKCLLKNHFYHVAFSSPKGLLQPFFICFLSYGVLFSY